MNFAVPVNHRVKIKVNEKLINYLDFAIELKKLWNMIAFTLGTLGKETQEIRDKKNRDDPDCSIVKISFKKDLEP